MDALGKMIDLTTAVIVMMILPVIWARGMNERLIMKYAQSLAEEFTEDVCHHGGISKERYETFLNGLSAVAYGLRADIGSCSHIPEPVYENGHFTGKVVDTERICFMEDITEKIYTGGKCSFCTGTEFYVTVAYKEEKMRTGGIVVSDPEDKP